ncbi:hypothetical protein nbrc107697_10970 [Gordonia crocea]|uniref:ABC transporter domain-containing protein n=1 Tax=Gordonia crocea TaxID=589162 RepID=A0A7I9UV51_9ACTN|nr:hypothetical protein nbrc107697_10970 [Gordonia crocea]
MLVTRAVAVVVILTASASALQASGTADSGYHVVSATADNAPKRAAEKRGPVAVPPLALPPSGAAGVVPAPPGGDLPSPQLDAPAPGGAPAPGTPGQAAPGTPGSPATPGALGGLPGAPLVTGPDGQDWRPTTKCPDWPEPRPEQLGGLSSMINLAPMAGPFMSEAFALGSVYQPVLSIAGPLLAEIEPIITRNLPWINPLIERVQAVLAVVLEAILPFYGPYRRQLLALEGNIARDLTPILQRWASTPQAVCFVAWQAQMIRNAKGGRQTVASLARPGERIRFSPKGKAVRVSASAGVAVEAGGLTVESAVKVKAGVAVLRGVSFSARPGEITALLGPNGAGKTTVLRAVLGLEPLTSGRVGIGGRQLADYRAPARAVGAVLDVDAYAPSRSVRGHLDLVATASRLDAEATARALRLVGLADYADARIGQLSLGMRQRLALAAALIGEPDVLVLDEPHNGLDAGAIRWLREVLIRYASSGRTVLLSTHLLSEVEALADRVVVLVDGTVTVDETAAVWAAGAGGLEERYLAEVGEL